MNHGELSRYKKMDFELYQLMPHDITVEPATGADAWGNRTYGTEATYKARIQNQRRKVVDINGEEVVSETTVYLATTVAISAHSRMTLPSGYVPRQPKIISIKRDEDQWGPYGTKIYA